MKIHRLFNCNTGKPGRLSKDERAQILTETERLSEYFPDGEVWPVVEYADIPDYRADIALYNTPLDTTGLFNYAYGMRSPATGDVQDPITHVERG